MKTKSKRRQSIIEKAFLNFDYIGNEYIDFAYLIYNFNDLKAPKVFKGND